jgi:hypothetical protein
MDIARFKANLSALGADLERWPPADAEAALALLSGSTEAQDLFARAAGDDLLMFGDDEADITGLADTIVKQVES